MPESQPNQIARVLAVFALVAAFLLVVVTIATSGGDGESDGGRSDGAEEAEDGEPTQKGERALDKGVWVVREGDTLVSIAEETGIDTDELIDLNPDIDPQVLTTGQRISLRPGLRDDDTEGDTIGNDRTATSPGTGVGDGGPVAPGSGVSDGIDSN